MDEKQAIAHLKQGDSSGLEVLVYLYQLRAVRAAYLIVCDRTSAEDIVQNAFIRAGERIGQFDAERSFGPWFLRSVVNDAIKAAKRQKRYVSLDETECPGRLDLADPAPLPEERVEADETSHAVWRAVQQLPPNQRAAIVLRYYLGMHEDEMTEELGGPAGTIKWWLHAARQRLRTLLHPLHTPDPPTTYDHPTDPDRDRESGSKR